MSEGPTGSRVLPPIRYADIVFAEISDPNGLNHKVRRVVVLTPDAALAAGFPVAVAGITGTLPDPLTADFVVLPWKNPPGRHPKTGMTKLRRRSLHMAHADRSECRCRAVGFRAPPRT